MEESKAIPLTTPKSWVVICSPVSGRKQGQQVVENELVPTWNAYLQDRVPLVVEYTKKQGHASELARKYGNRDCGVIAVGGDGTIHEIIHGLMSAGTLEETPLAMLSQGTMNFYAVTAGLPSVREVPVLIKDRSFRRASLLRVRDNANRLDTISFEAFHIGSMAYHVVQGAQDWRFRPGGPMAGIFLYLISCNLVPSFFTFTGELKLYSSNSEGPSFRTLKDRFFWIIASHRNPYTGCVGETMWISTMSLGSFPGFARMMQFFKPPMEHFSGLAYSFEQHYECDRFRFETLTQKLQGCIDGDPFTCGNTIAVENLRQVCRIVAPRKFPRKIPPEFQEIDSITPAAQRWLSSNPPPPGTVLHAPKRATKEETAEGPEKIIFALLVLALLIIYRRDRRKTLLDAGTI